MPPYCAPPALNGIFAVYKPAGMTSAKCLDIVKDKIFKGIGFGPKGQRAKSKFMKVGHGGTLDPMAEGILVVGLGDGCKKLSSYLSGNKEYRFELTLGTHYDTFDTTGSPLETKDFGHVTRETVQEVIPRFTGQIMQIPPAFSALRIDGQRAYDLARKGASTAPQMSARPIQIDSLILDSFEPPKLSFTAHVGGGCYIRSLCVDLAGALGTKGAMSKLVRSRQSQFTLDNCLTMQDCDDLERIKASLLET